MRALIAPLALAIALGTATTASAQTESAPPTTIGTNEPVKTGGSQGPTVWGILGGWYGGWGIGGRYMVPLPVKPLLAQTPFHDYFAIEFGADYLTWSYDFAAANGDYRWNALVPVVGGMWNVWFTEKLAAYPKLDIGYQIGWYSGWNSAWGNQPHHGAIFWNFAVGGMYRLSKVVALRGELGYAGVKGGATFLF